jgi:hypothetical protein
MLLAIVKNRRKIAGQTFAIHAERFDPFTDALRIVNLDRVDTASKNAFDRELLPIGRNARVNAQALIVG